MPFNIGISASMKPSRRDNDGIYSTGIIEDRKSSLIFHTCMNQEIVNLTDTRPLQGFVSNCSFPLFAELCQATRFSFSHPVSTICTYISLCVEHQWAPLIHLCVSLEGWSIDFHYFVVFQWPTVRQAIFVATQNGQSGKHFMAQ